jgi:hypothetical protein
MGAGTFTTSGLSLAAGGLNVAITLTFKTPTDFTIQKHFNKTGRGVKKIDLTSKKGFIP